MKFRRIWPVITVVTFFTVFLFVVTCVYAAGPSGEYLNYQEPKAAGTSWLSTIAYLFSVLITFAVVIGLAYFTSRFLGVKMGRFSGSGDTRVLVHLPLGPNRSVQVVDIAGKILVLGVTDHNINLLQEINDPQQIESLKNAPQPAATLQFDAVFKRHLASLQQMSGKFPGVFGPSSRNDTENDREKR